MVKIRLRRMGMKRTPHFRVVVINSREKREGRPIEELGFYNPKTKEMKLNKDAALEWIKKGAQPSETVQYLINNCNEDGSLNYQKKEVEKISKKAQAKLAEAKKAEEEAKAAQEATPAQETKAEDAAEEAATEAPAEEAAAE